MIKLELVFKTKKPVIGMLHLDYLEGEDFKGIDYVVKRATRDINSLQKGGIDGILIENWKEDSIGEFVSIETEKNFEQVVLQLAKKIKVPFGLNVLNNDYKVALRIARLSGASFVELDVFVDFVKSDFKYSPISSKNSFEIKLNPKDVIDYAKSISAKEIGIFVFVQPKHYIMLDKNKTIEESTQQAIKEGAEAVLVTKATGFAPTVDLVRRVKSVSGNIPVGIGSGFNLENAKDFLNIIDFAVVGSSIKIDGDVDNFVDKNRVKQLMDKIKGLRNNYI